jgi:hypothetical protein
VLAPPPTAQLTLTPLAIPPARLSVIVAFTAGDPTPPGASVTV